MKESTTFVHLRRAIRVFSWRGGLLSAFPLASAPDAAISLLFARHSRHVLGTPVQKLALHVFVTGPQRRLVAHDDEVRPRGPRVFVAPEYFADPPLHEVPVHRALHELLGNLDPYASAVHVFQPLVAAVLYAHELAVEVVTLLVHDALKVALGLDSLAGAENFTGYALVLRLTGAESMNVSARDTVGG